VYFGGSRQNTADYRAREELKRELDLTNERIAKLRTAIDRSHQMSALRSVEDHMRATKKELALVKGEIQVLREEAMRQRRVLEGSHSHQLLKSLEREIANERAIHTQLRKEALKIGPSCHVHSKSVTVLS
jgi:chromosome segregation ATPase